MRPLVQFGLNFIDPDRVDGVVIRSGGYWDTIFLLVGGIEIKVDEFRNGSPTQPDQPRPLLVGPEIDWDRWQVEHDQWSEEFERYLDRATLGSVDEDFDRFIALTNVLDRLGLTVEATVC